jgi:hypothetical protein
MDDFTTVFIFTDSADGAFRSIIQSSVCVTIIVIIIGGFIFGSAIKNQKKDTQIPNGISVVILVVFLMYFIANALAGQLGDYTRTNLQYRHLLDVYNNQQYRVAEGIVEVLHTQPWSGHDKGDIIRIGQATLEVNYYVATVGYKKTIANGGVLKNGVYARVYYTDGTILRVDIKNYGGTKQLIFLPLVLRNAD